MIPRSIVVTVVLLLAGGAAARAQSPCVDAARGLTSRLSPDGVVTDVSPAVLAQRVNDLRALLDAPGEPQPIRARRACVAAELLKRLGDSGAHGFYEQSIALDPSNAEYHLLYGDWLRTFRGPEQPLVKEAAAQYCAGLAYADGRLRRQIDRSLIALYERDGLPVVGPLERCGMRVFFSVQSAGAHGPDDPEQPATMRTLTSAALFIESGPRLGQALTVAQLQDLLRNTWRGAALGRLRTRVRTFAIDAYFAGDGSVGSQVYDFRQPNSQGNIVIGLGGVGVEDVVGTRWVDLMVRGDVRVGERRGLVETLPNATEAVRSTTVRAIGSRFVGPNKISVELTADHDAVTQHVAVPIDRDLDFVGVTARYQIFGPLGGSRPYERPIAPRGSEVFVGRSRQSEAFGSVTVDSTDWFAGASFKGFPGGGSRSFDVTVQPTFFDYRRRGVENGEPAAALVNAQWEMFGTLLYRILDRENERSADRLPPLVFLNVVGLASVGKARVGPADFDRYRGGVQIDAKLVGQRLGGGTTILASGRYEFQNFVHLNTTQHVVSASVNIGF